MPTVIDSLFLELGIDTSKFSADQQRALAKIAEFEKKSKKGAKDSATAVKTVGQAFKDIADDTSVGRSAKGIGELATKLKALGQAGKVSGGAGTALGGMAEGLGMLLSPAALGVAALGLVGMAAWDLNKRMTATNATIVRQSQLAGMNAKSLWSWGEAARTVGAQPQDVTAGIAALQTAVTGMGIGAGDATAQLVAASRLGIGWNFKTGINIGQLFERVHEMAAARGYRNLGALRALTAPLMNDAMFNIATNRTYDPAKLESYIKASSPAAIGATLEKSLRSQTILGKLGIQKDVMAETAYGGVQGPMAALVTLLTNLLGLTSKLLGYTIKIADDIANGVIGELTSLVEWFVGVKPNAKPASPMVGGVTTEGNLPADFKARQAMAMHALMGRGLSQADAAAIVGNMSQESSLNPVATSDNGAHIGLMQLDAARQAQFAKYFGYKIGSQKVPLRQQFLDEVMFAQVELQRTQPKAAAMMAQAPDLAGKTAAFAQYDERPGDDSLAKRIAFAEQAFNEMSQVTAEYRRLFVANNPRAGVIDRAPRLAAHPAAPKRNTAPSQVVRAPRLAAHPAVIHHADHLAKIGAMLAAAHARPHVHHHKTTNDTRIGDIHVHTPSTDPRDHAKVIKSTLSTHPLLGPVAQHQVTLATGAVAG